MNDDNANLYMSAAVGPGSGFYGRFAHIPFKFLAHRGTFATLDFNIYFVYLCTQPNIRVGELRIKYVSRC